MELLTPKYIKDRAGCDSGIEFMVRNGLEGFPLDRIDEVEGDYEGFIEWLIARPECDYDEAGNVSTNIYADGNTYSFEYDDAGRKIKETYPDGGVYTWEYDIAGNNIKATRPIPCGGSDAPEFIYEYDTAGNRIKETCVNDGRVAEYEYDAAGNKTKYVSPDGMVFQNEYDDGRLIKQTSSNGDVYTFEYDTNGYLIKEGVPGLTTWLYEYDAVGNRVKSSDNTGINSEQSFDHNDDGTFTITIDGEVVLTVPKFDKV